ncbi:MAG: response regulator [Magnetococcales bacterium]|nr:response regulator [Magnetococcales bacterium]MBF0439579.1 response regulator [Magnetococcales bacterium]
MNILIVDDNAINRKILWEYLKSYGQCDMASNGVEAVEQFEAELATGNPYDLVLMDLMMPRMNGQNALNKIRDIERKHRVTMRDQVVIIIVTGASSPEELLKTSDRNSGLLKKPVRQAELIDKLKRHGLI